MAVKAKWKGGSYKEKGDDFEFLSGVPARDLTDEDYAALDTEMKASVRNSPLYDVKSEVRTESTPTRTAEAEKSAPAEKAGGNS